VTLGPLDRRAFLRLATRGRERVLEVSCERLYVRWVDARPTESVTDLIGDSGWLESPGEPPSQVVAPTRDELLRQLDASLAGAHAVRLIEPEWLADANLRREVNARVARFREKGGRLARAGYDRHVPPRSAMAMVALLAAFLVAPPVSAQAYPDDLLRTRIEAALAAAADLPADSLGVAVREGVVTITGSVLCDGCGGNATPGAAGTVQQSLGAVVRAVPGVVGVRFALRYRPG
jgi:hypothetical protein